MEKGGVEGKEKDGKSGSLRDEKGQLGRNLKAKEQRHGNRMEVKGMNHTG